MSLTYLVEHAEAARIALDLGEAKKQRPLIRYAGSAAETSIGSKPIGSELSAGFYSWRRGYQALVRGLSSQNHNSRGLKPIPDPSANQAENLGLSQFFAMSFANCSAFQFSRISNLTREE